MISLDSYLEGRDVKFPDEFTDEILKAAKKTIAKSSELLSAFGKKRKVVSGWRPVPVNKMLNGQTKSQHIWANAIDIEDGDGEFRKWCINNIERLVEIGLWMEYGPPNQGHVHLQTIAPRSGNRIFVT